MTALNDVDLEALLASAEGSEGAEPSGASDQEPAAEEPAIDPALTEEEKASARENDRVRKLADENRILKEEKEAREKASKAGDGSYEDLDSFFAAIEDEPSKKLLRTFGDLMEKKYNSRVAPVLDEHNETKFDREFEAFAAKAPSLNLYKKDLRQSFLRNPSQSVKALVGEVVMDNLMNKVKPIERKGAEPKRGAVDLTGATKDDLYAALEANRPN